MFKTRVISDNGLQPAGQGFVLDIRLPWYRALPLSTVEIAQVKVDGKVIPASSIAFRLNGETLALNQMEDRDQDWWYVLDSACLEVSNHPLPPGSEHEVTVVIGLRPPYIPGFYRMTECTKRLIASPVQGAT